MDEYPRVTQAQLEIWLDSPVTKTYLQCLKWSAEQITEAMGSGVFIDFHNADTTFGAMRDAIGHRNGFMKSSDPTEQLNKHEMLEIPKEGDDGEAA